MHGVSILLARAATPEQERFVGDQVGGRVFLFLRTDGFVREPAEQPYGTVAVFEDLYGNRWDLIGPAPA